MRRPAAAAAVALPLVLLSACGGLGYDRLPDVDVADLPSTTTTAARDLSGVFLAGVPGTTTTTLPSGRRRATLTGTVAGPDGPIAGAVVRLEWLIADRDVVSDVRTNGEGVWKLTKAPGGRYRVRAWRAPDLADVEPQLVLIRDDEKRQLDFRLRGYGGRSVDTALAPSQPVVGEHVNLVVRLADRRVDDDGVVRARPVTGASVELFGQGSWSLQSPNPATTAGDGTVTFTISCRASGHQPLSVAVNGGDVTNLDVPDCVPRAPDTTTTTTFESTTTTFFDETTSTTGD
jgi:hypothetical protein